MPSFVVSGDLHGRELGLHDREASVASIFAARDRFPYSRADGICGRSSYYLHVIELLRNPTNVQRRCEVLTTDRQLDAFRFFLKRYSTPGTATNSN